METKNLIIAILITTLIVFVFTFLQGRSNQPTSTAETESQLADERIDNVTSGLLIPTGDDPEILSTLNHQTNIFSIEFSQENGSIKTMELLPSDQIGDNSVALISNNNSYPDPFSLLWGGEALNVLYNARKTPQGYVFSRTFTHTDPNVGTDVLIEKEYVFYPNEYIYDLEIRIQLEEGSSSIEPYALYVGPQLVEESLQTQSNQNVRVFSYYNNRRRTKNVRDNRSETLVDRVRWIGFSDKYFSILLIPDNLQYAYTFRRNNSSPIEEHAMIVQRPPIKSGVVQDVYKFYVGPKRQNTLSKYSDAEDNSLGLQGLELEDVLDARVLFGWLENILKFGLQWLYVLFPNYGISIIILTLLVKLMLLPLTLRGQRSMERMQALNPQTQELREKYGEDRQKMNVELNALYRKEKVNPLGGCLPLLIQFPFFIAMYGLFNNHFDLRGATFISGWINDLSAPEMLFQLPFTIPLVNWDAIRGLPIIFIGTQLITIFVQPNVNSGGTSQGQAALMKYGLPIFLFFVLYNSPSGLLVYWISSNVLTVVQQWISTFIKKRNQYA